MNIVSFDIPFPPNYGGVIDVFYKIKAFHQLGQKVTLHCFQYNQRKPDKTLLQYCDKVHYYPRDKSIRSLSLKTPFIVKSRKHNQLLQNLQQDNNPILFEGLHSCYYLSHPLLKERFKMVRAHNVEAEYYSILANNETNLLKRGYYFTESFLLRQYEKNLMHSDLIMAISPNDHQYFSKKFKKTYYLPVFHNQESITIQEGKGTYALYHGNLSVNENITAAMFLLEKIIPSTSIAWMMAGKNPPPLLQQRCKEKNVQLIPNSSHEQMQQLLQNAHVNVLPTFQPTGIKLKLLNALHSGRYCIANDFMVQNTGLAPLCLIANNPEAFIQHLHNIQDQSFTQPMIETRKRLLKEKFDNIENARKLLEFVGA